MGRTKSESGKHVKEAQRATTKQRELLSRTTIKQGLGFALVGTGGVFVNGIVYALLSQLEIFRGIPFPYWIFKEITWAWGIGILVAFVFNFILNKWLVFKA